jgi:predicted permease
VLFGLAPAFRSGRLDLCAALKGTAASVAGGIGRQRSLQALVIVQVGLSLVLLVGAGLFIRTLRQLKGLDAGFSRENVILFDIDFADRPEPAQWTALYRELLARLEALPDVRSSSLFNWGLLSGNFWTDSIIPEGYQAEPGENLECAGTAVGLRFFETFGMPVLSGRDFGVQDERRIAATNATAPRTAVINQAMVRRYFGEANPVGRRFHFAHKPETPYEIVGVVPDAKYRTLRESPPPTVYVPFFQEERSSGTTFALRSKTDPRVAMANIARVVRDVDRTVRVRDVRTMSDVVDGSVQQERLIARLGGFFSGVALALACLGLYGVLSFAVVQRTREIGVRVALGAQRREVLSLVIRKGLGLVLVGALLGLAGALAATRLVSNLLYGVEPNDPMTFAGVTGLLIAVALMASWLPARRAAKVDPMEALRCE